MKDKTSLNAVATPVVSMSKYLNYVLDSYYTYDNDNQKLRFIMEQKTENCLVTEKSFEAGVKISESCIGFILNIWQKQ